MTLISGFTFIHNAIESGYPIVEAIEAIASHVDEIVVVDMESTDGTRDLLYDIDIWHLDNINFMIIDGKWGNQAGETLSQAHGLYKKCSGDIIIHFEADEVYDKNLIANIMHGINSGHKDIAVHRLQLEQNFQRCRWYPEPVHRVFPRESNTVKRGHTTNRHGEALVFPPEKGYLWDITNCFRDNWLNRVNKQAELRGSDPHYLLTPIHSTFPAVVEQNIAIHWMEKEHWTWKTTPFNIPDILKPLVGETKYEPRV